MIEIWRRQLTATLAANTMLLAATVVTNKSLLAATLDLTKPKPNS